MPINLTGKPILITGASAGIGRATALACARAGMPVVAAARREDRLVDLVREIAELGGRAAAVACDVTNPSACQAAVDRAAAEFGPLYSVFANAGYGYEQPVHLSSDHEIRQIFETNFWGSLNIIRPALAAMLQRREGHVLLCSSCLSKIGVPRMAAYTATKAAQDHFGRAMRHELAGTGVHVSTVHPIGTRTEFSEQMTTRSGAEARLWSTPESYKQPASTVADAVVRCLRRPRGEVWTSWPVRALMGLATALPGTADAVLRRRAKRSTP